MLKEKIWREEIDITKETGILAARRRAKHYATYPAPNLLWKRECIKMEMLRIILLRTQYTHTHTHTHTHLSLIHI